MKADLLRTRLDGARGTLAARIARRDRATFAGRERELRIVDGLFGDDPPSSVLLVHGPAGIGKSALLREVERRGRAAGWAPVRVDGGAPEARLAAASALPRPLVLLDGDERIAALGDRLRGVLLPALPERAVVAIAGRRPPAHGWFEGGWETVAFELALGPLSREESRALLACHGLARDARAAAICAAAAGSPLALRAAARAARADPCWWPEAPPAPVDAEAVREALRSLHVPSVLARSPLARGRGAVERAASVRALIEDAAEHAFGDSRDERLLREVLVRGYLDPARGHEQAAGELHMSRSTYFRRLRVASDRVAAHLLAAAGRAPV